VVLTGESNSLRKVGGGLNLNLVELNSKVSGDEKNSLRIAPKQLRILNWQD
jgi:hypothetical protein